jgi:N-acetyl-alpha-D-glucosaminyl L-malate synthase BshA
VNVALLCFHALGGSGVVAAELARELARHGHRVHIVAPSLPSRIEPAPEGVTLHRVAIEDAPPVGSQGYAIALAARLTDVVLQERIDVVHAHYAVPHAAAAAMCRAALGPRAPRLVVTLHGTDVPPDDTPEGRRLVLRSTILSADALTAPSHALAAQARGALHLNGELPLEVIPNFVDVELFRPSPTPLRASLQPLFPRARVDWDEVRVVTHASNLRPVKRPLDVLHAFARLREQRPALLVIAGEGPKRAALEHEARVLGVQDSVAFFGAARDLVPLLQASDLFLLPSQSESFGLAALEAMACGVPVLASRAGGLPEVIAEGETGLLLAPGDVDGFAAAAHALLADESRRAALGKAARDRAEKIFRPGPIVARWEELYASLLAKPLRAAGLW